MSTVGWALYISETSRTDEVWTALQLDTDVTTELIHLVAGPTDLHLRTVALTLVSTPNTVTVFMT